MAKISDIEIYQSSVNHAIRQQSDTREFVRTTGDELTTAAIYASEISAAPGYTNTHATLAGLFASQAAALPSSIALSFGAEHLSYAELDLRSDELAGRLATAGIGPGAIIGLCLPRSPQLIVALLAILKAGAAYLPLDPAYPAERLSFMVEDTDAALVIGTAGTTAWLPTGWRRLDSHGAEPAAIAPRRQRFRAPEPHDLAYVIYTSGSTGRPKGVAVEHAAVVRLFGTTQPWFGFGADDVWSLFHSVSFDFSVWEIWGALLHGGRLVIVPESATRDPEACLRLLSGEGVTVFNQTPSAFGAFDQADRDRAGRDKLALRLVIFGGEALDPRRLAGWYGRRGEGARLVNMYGITETTVHVTYRPLSPADTATSGSPIGEAIPDLEMLLLDGDTMCPVAPGEVGEIFVGGAGLARGYLNRPELNAARFVPHPWKAGERLYRSGDLGRLMASGEYEHLGRADQQVKIRGFRIELGEIETALMSHPAVRQAVVVLSGGDDGDKCLLGYCVPTEGALPAAHDLRVHLARNLPEHMIPSAFVSLAALPLTVNGKLDRAALPQPEPERPHVASGILPPRNEAERLVADAVARVLRLDRVGIDENFFDLGANSLQLVEIHRILRLRAPALDVLDLYRRPNVRALVAHLAAGRGASPDLLAAARLRGQRARSGSGSNVATAGGVPASASDG